MRPLPSGLATRNALGDYDDIDSRLVFSGREESPPLVTIAIPTYRRHDLLAEAVRSALDQEFAHPFEVIVLDNDPESDGLEKLLAALPELPTRNFRYYVNCRNLGMYPNHNRCIVLARGEWLSILNDDDLLLPEFLRTAFSTLDARPEIAALGARKRRLDERVEDAATPPALWRVLAYKLVTELEFRGRPFRRIPPSKIFWGTPMDNLAGFICRRSVLVLLGGFPPEDEWSSDTWVYLRIAAAFGLYQHRASLAVVRVRRNESMRPEVLASFLRQGARIRRALIGVYTPAWFRRLEPLALAQEQADYKGYWGISVPLEPVATAMGLKRERSRPILWRCLKLVFGGF